MAVRVAMAATLQQKAEALRGWRIASAGGMGTLRPGSGRAGQATARQGRKLWGQR